MISYRNLFGLATGIYIAIGILLTALAHLSVAVSQDAQDAFIVPWFFEPVRFILDLFF